MLISDPRYILCENEMSRFGPVCYADSAEIDKSLLIETGATALFITSTLEITTELISGTQIRFVGSATSGTDHIDIAGLTRENVYVADARGSNANAVTTYVVSALAELCQEVRGLTILVVGYGHIGSRVARTAHRLGMKVLINDPPEFIRGRKFEFEHCDLSEGLSQADVITLHVSLTRLPPFPSQGLIDVQQVNTMRGKAILINTSRGSVITTAGLEALVFDSDKTVVLDVWPGEPEPPAKLVEHATLSTPHIAGYTQNARVAGCKSVVEQYSLFLSGNLNKPNAEHESDTELNALNWCTVRELLRGSFRLLERSTLFRDEYLSAPTRDTFFRIRSSWPLETEPIML